MGLQQVNPLRGLWGGASLERRELPWTRKERKGRRREKGKKEVRAKVLFCGGKDAPAWIV
jgi:hypothetical protein